jgi:SAM-dependent methyltransferase
MLGGNMSDLLVQLKEEMNQDFKGWDFSYLDDRMQEFPLPWNYKNEISKYLNFNQVLLDMGTGGGEFLSSLKELPKSTFATEAYLPNVPIAKKRLEPLGVKVHQIKEDDRLPFSDHSIDLVINRHEAYSSQELKRIIKPGGLFITQQVGGLNDSDINLRLGAKPSPYLDWKLEVAVKRLRAEGFEILRQKECLTHNRFYDTGALVNYLKCIPWQVSDFSIEKYIYPLTEINHVIEQKGYIDFIKHRFLIVARHP